MYAKGGNVCVCRLVGMVVANLFKKQRKASVCLLVDRQDFGGRNESITPRAVAKYKYI